MRDTSIRNNTRFTKDPNRTASWLSLLIEPPISHGLLVFLDYFFLYTPLKTTCASIWHYFLLMQHFYVSWHGLYDLVCNLIVFRTSSEPFTINRCVTVNLTLIGCILFLNALNQAIFSECLPVHTLEFAARCKDRTCFMASSLAAGRGTVHSPFSSAAARIMSCSTLALSINWSSVFCRMVSTRFMTEVARDERRCRSSSSSAVSLRAASRIQNLWSNVMMFSATACLNCGYSLTLKNLTSVSYYQNLWENLTFSRLLWKWGHKFKLLERA